MLSPFGHDDFAIKQPNFEIIYLKEFDEDQIKEVLHKRVPENWERYWQIIRDIYDLPNLAQRPVMLDMIITSLPDIEKFRTINHAMLYKIYTDKWIEKDRTEERTLINADSKRYFTREVSWEMFKTSALSVNIKRIRELVESHLVPRIKSSKNISYLESGFLSRICG